MEKTKKSTVVGFHVTREPRSFAYPFVSSPYDRCSAETANFRLFCLVLSCHSPIIIHALVRIENRRHVVCKNVLRLAGEPPIVRVLNDFQPLLILRVN